MKTLKRIGTIVISVILWAIILLAALYAFTTMATKDDQSVSRILGYTPMTVESDSMKPTFCKGDLIFIKKCDTSKLKEGDIITFHTIIDNQYALNTHRIQKIDEVNGVRSYTTIGDNNNGVADQHVISDGDIVGKYVGHISNLGKVMNFLSSSMGFLIVIVLPMLLFFIYQVYNLIMISIRLKKAIAVENAEELAKEGMTMIVVTHEMGFAKTVADRVIFLENGKIVEENDAKAFYENPKTERAQDFLKKVMH